MLKSIIAVSFALVLAAPAQTKIVVPEEYAGKDAPGVELTPFGWVRVRCTQFMGLGMLIKIKRGSRITEIAYRRDHPSLYGQTLNRPASSWEIRMANYFGHAKSPSTQYLRPGGGLNQLTSVFNGTVQWPPLLSYKSGWQPFVIRFKLSRPFTTVGLGLAIDHYSYGNRSIGYYYLVDAVRKDVDAGSWQAYGKSCPVDENRGYAVPSNPGNDQPFELLLFGGPPRSVAIGVLGASDKQWGPIKLPFDLSAFGMPGCAVLASQEVLLPTPTFTTGGARLAFDLPLDPRLAGLRLFAQWMTLDPTKSVPLRFSNGMDVTLGTSLGNHGGPDAALVFGVGGVARLSYGFLDPGVALVTEFTLM